MADFKTQGRAHWEIDALARLQRCGSLGKHAVNFVANRNVKLTFTPQTTGAKWTLIGMLLGPPVIAINSKQAKAMKEGKDAWSISLIAHEAKHYEQGLFVALSVFGELEAWQLQMRVLRDLKASPSHPALLALEKLKLSHDPQILKEAARLMKEASPGYRIDLLPLNPILNLKF